MRTVSRKIIILVMWFCASDLYTICRPMRENLFLLNAGESVKITELLYFNI